MTIQVSEEYNQANIVLSIHVLYMTSFFNTLTKFVGSYTFLDDSEVNINDD